MVDFTVTGPDGKKYPISGPEGTTEDDAIAQVKKQLGVSSAPKPDTGTNKKQPGMLSDVLQSLTQGMEKGIVGTGGLEPDPVFKGTPYKSTTGLGEATERVGEGLATPSSWMGPGGPLAKAGLSTLSSVGSYLGEQFGGKPGAVIGGMVAPTVPGLAKAGVSGLARPLAAERADRVKDVGVLRSEGIEPTAGDVSGRAWMQGLQRGDRLTGSYEKTALPPIEQFTSRLAEKIGQKSDRIDAPTLAAARRDLGKVYDEAADKVPIVENYKVGGKRKNVLGEKLVQITQDMAMERTPDAVRNQIEAAIDQVMRGFETKDSGLAVMSGKTYKEYTKKGSFLDRLQNDPTTKHFATQIDRALKDSITRTAAKSAERKELLSALRDADKKWYNMIVLSEAASGPGPLAARGLIEPERLRAILTRGQENKLGYALEKGDLHELTRAATSVMSPYHAQGSFMERAATYGAPSAIGAVTSHFMGGDPFAGAAMGAASPTAMGALVNSPMGQRFLKKQTESPGPDWYNLMLKAGRGGATALYQE